MKLSQAELQNYTEIIKNELIPAMGCTEPIAIAYAGAVARKVLEEEPAKVSVNCSGNIIKNVKGVTVPNSGGLKGVAAAALLGIVGGDPDRRLEVIESVSEEARQRTKELAEAELCRVSYKEGVPNLYIEVEAEGAAHTVRVVIRDRHTNIVLIERDGKTILSEGSSSCASLKEQLAVGDRSRMSLRGILDYAEQVELSEVEPILKQQIELNSAIAQEGLDNAWGASVGKTILETWGNDVKSCACAKAAAGSDARMSGCPKPVVINSGSGNQGITVTMPVVVYAEELQVSPAKRYRALLVSNLVSIYIKHYIGPLSAFCGAVSASCGAGAGITYLCGGDYGRIAKTITNTLGNVGGIVCDGAKPSCAAKIASSVNAAILAHHMSMNDKSFQPGEGIVEEDVEQTIRNMGYIGKVGMKPTDKEILNVMTDSVDVNAVL